MPIASGLAISCGMVINACLNSCLIDFFSSTTRGGSMMGVAECFSARPVAQPHNRPDRKAVTPRNRVNRPPNIPYVSINESTPVCGVEDIKERTADVEAPCFLSDMLKGSTPQEQIGIGTPKSAALRAGKRL